MEGRRTREAAGIGVASDVTGRPRSRRVRDLRGAGLGLAAVAMLVLPGRAAAQRLGGEIPVNGTTTDEQSWAAVAPAGADGFVVVWQSWGQDGSGYGIYAQRFDGDGAPAGGEIHVSTTTNLSQEIPDVAAGVAGGFTVVWTSYQQDSGSSAGVYARSFDANGAPVTGEVGVNTTVQFDQKGGKIAGDASGNLAAVWWSQVQDGSGEGVYLRLFGPGGTPVSGEIAVNTTTAGMQWRPVVAADGSGNFDVAWSSDQQDGSGHGVFVRRFDGSGVPLSGEIPVNTFTAGEQTAPAIAADADDNFAIVWTSEGQDGSGPGIYARAFDATGTPLVGEQLVNQTTIGDQSAPKIANDGDAGWIVTWQDLSAGDVYARRLDRRGVPVGTELVVNTFLDNTQLRPAVSATAGGDVVVAWESAFQIGPPQGTDIYAQRFRHAHFLDGFGGGTVCGWSSAVGGGTCP